MDKYKFYIIDPMQFDNFIKKFPKKSLVKYMDLITEIMESNFLYTDQIDNCKVEQGILTENLQLKITPLLHNIENVVRENNQKGNLFYIRIRKKQFMILSIFKKNIICAKTPYG